MKKVLSSCALFLSIFNTSYGVETEVFFNLGKSFSNKLGKFKAEDGGNYGLIPLHEPGTTADLGKNPNSSNVMGFEANFFFNQMLGLNIDATYSNYETQTSNTKLIEGVSGAEKVISFPRFDSKISTFSVGPIVRLEAPFSPFISIGYTGATGTINNTKFSTNPTEYGVGGKDITISMHGFTAKVGGNHTFKNNIILGAEYRFEYLKIKDTNQQFRSFNTGFTGSLRSHMLMLKLGYSFNNK